MKIEQIREFLSKIKKIQSIMIDVATNQHSIYDAEDEYKELYQDVEVRFEIFQSLGLLMSNPNNFRTIWEWRDFWQSELDNPWAARRKYVNELYLNITEPVEKAIRLQGLKEISSEELFLELKRRFSRMTAAQTSPHPDSIEECKLEKLENNRDFRNFFISYNRFDEQWAEWIAWTLEAAGYSVIIQAWDFRPGGNFILDMQRAATKAEKTIAVLSETYLKSVYARTEWAAAAAEDPNALQRKLIPIKVKECQPEGLLKAIAYVDLVGASKAEAKQKLLDMMRDRVKPDQEPDFPGEGPDSPDDTEQAKSQPAPFPPEATRPKATNRIAEIKRRNLEQQMQSLEDEYNAAFEQLQYTNDAVHRTRLERQIQLIEQQLTTAAKELDAL